MFNLGTKTHNTNSNNIDEKTNNHNNTSKYINNEQVFNLGTLGFAHRGLLQALRDFKDTIFAILQIILRLFEKLGFEDICVFGPSN